MQKLNENLTNGARKWFWWVELQLNHICHIKNERDVQNVLQHLPTALQDINDGILEQIFSNEHGKHASKLTRHAFS